MIEALLSSMGIENDDETHTHIKKNKTEKMYSSSIKSIRILHVGIYIYMYVYMKTCSFHGHKTYPNYTRRRL